MRIMVCYSHRTVHCSPFTSHWFILCFLSLETSPGGESFIGPEGMQQLCQDLGLDPEDIVMLAIAWKLKASQMGYFQRSEWLSGMQQLQ